MTDSLVKNFLTVRDLWVSYPSRAGQDCFTAVKGVGFDIPQRRTMGLVGESGSGKSSTALAVMRLIRASAGSISLGGVELTSLTGRALRAQRPKFQMIFQDPASSLNPRQRAVDILTEPMHLCGLGQKSQRIEMARELLAQVGLSSSSLMLFPHQFSGGQRQRLVIARALATRPELVVADEPVSALDAAVQAQILNLLGSLRDNFGLTVLFISHDLGVVQHACHEVGVMYRGLLIERAPTEKLFSAPAHPYTWALLSASVTDWGLREALKTIFGSGLENGVAADPDQKEKAARKKSLTPNFETTQPVSSTRSITKSIKWAISGCLKESGGQILNPRLSEDGSEGCNFLQCPLAEEKCRTQEPVLTEFEPGHLSRCRLAAEIRRQGQAVLELASSPAFGQMTAAA